MNVAANLPEDKLLIEAAKSDPSRFAELYEKNFTRVYAFIFRRVRDRDAAEDLTAEVFHQALKSLGRFQWRGLPFAAWLLRIAANTLADRWQRSAAHPELPHDDPPEPVCSTQLERTSLVFELVERLPDDQRAVIVRRFVDQESIREIAAQLGRSEGAVKQLQFRALQTLRSHLRNKP